MLINEVLASGNLTQSPVRTGDGKAHFLMEAAEGEKPFHCFCEGKTAENVLRFCKAGDEIAIEGELRWHQFRGEAKPRLLIWVRFVSYGRKEQSSLPDGGMA